VLVDTRILNLQHIRTADQEIQLDHSKPSILSVDIGKHQAVDYQSIGLLYYNNLACTCKIDHNLVY